MGEGSVKAYTCVLSPVDEQWAVKCIRGVLGTHGCYALRLWWLNVGSRANTAVIGKGENVHNNQPIP